MLFDHNIHNLAHMNRVGVLENVPVVLELARYILSFVLFARRLRDVAAHNHPDTRVEPLCYRGRPRPHSIE